MRKKSFFFTVLLCVIFAGTAWALYKAPVREIGPKESYPAFLTSEGVTIAVEPLYTDELAARAFDKKDMITRGILPIEVVIFNDNDFAVKIDGLSVELIHRDRSELRIRTMSPNEVVSRLSRKDKTWSRQPIPRRSQFELNRDMLKDFDDKFMMDKTVKARGKGSGFLYLHVPLKASEKMEEFLAGAQLYIPKVYRTDDGSRMIFFEVDIAPVFKTKDR